MCYTFRLPADKETIVREIEPVYGQATHHLGIYYTFQQDEPEGEFECPELTRDNWIPLYGGGVESGTLSLPEGAGFHLKPNQQILVQLHLLNAASEPVTDKAKIIFRTLDNADAVQAGMFGFDNRAINVPAQAQNHEESMTCSPIGRDMDVFAVFGHMHQHGKHIEVSRGANPGDEVLYDADWKFEEQPTEPKLFHVAKDDTIHVRCWYDNSTAQDLPYGESTFNEMCSFVFYYTPYKSLFGCLKNP